MEEHKVGKMKDQEQSCLSNSKSFHKLQHRAQLSPLSDIVVTINQLLTTETKGQSGTRQNLLPLGSAETHSEMANAERKAAHWLLAHVFQVLLGEGWQGKLLSWGYGCAKAAPANVRWAPALSRVTQWRKSREMSPMLWKGSQKHLPE